MVSKKYEMDDDSKLAALSVSGCACGGDGIPTEQIDAEKARKLSRTFPMVRDLGAREDIVRGHVPRSDVLVRQVGHDLALFDPSTAMIHLLNPSAAAIWNHVTPERTLSSIFDMFEIAYANQKVEARTILNDVENTLGKLKKMRLVVKAGEKPQKPVLFDRELSTVITGRDLTTLSDRYTPPDIKSFTLGELADIFDGRQAGTKEFCDTWLMGVVISACCESGASCCPFA